METMIGLTRGYVKRQISKDEGAPQLADYIDVLIPGLIGMVLLIWPQSMFLGSRATPDAKKLRLLRGAGGLLLLVAALFLGLKLVS